MYFSSHTVEPVLATTWILGHAFSVPSIRGFKCTECVLENATTWEMRIADTGGRPEASNQPGKGDHIRQIERKTLFRSSNFPLTGTLDERSSRLWAPLALSLPIMPPACMWELPIADDDGSRRGMMCTTLLRFFEPNLANETTWEILPHIPSPFGGRNSQVRLSPQDDSVKFYQKQGSSNLCGLWGRWFTHLMNWTGLRTICGWVQWKIWVFTLRYLLPGCEMVSDSQWATCMFSMFVEPSVSKFLVFTMHGQSITGIFQCK